MNTLIELVGGAALIAVGAWVFWRIDHGLSPRLRKMPGIDSAVVLIVLGCWGGGAFLFIPALVAMFSK